MEGGRTDIAALLFFWRTNSVQVVRIKDWMTTNVVTVDKTKSVKQAASLMDAHDIGTLVVVENKKPIGVFTERDILRQIITMELNPANVEIGTFMTREPILIDENADIAKAGRTMTLNKVKRLPVVNSKGELVGIITSTDLIKKLGETLTK